MKRICLIGSHVALAAAVLAGCSSDRDPTAEGRNAKVIDAIGGEVATDDGAKVTVPEGALDEGIEITVGAVAESDLSAPLPSDTTLAGSPQRFLPHGTTFDSPVTIELPHNGTATRVLHLDDEADTTWEQVEGTQIRATTAIFDVSSFSIYAPAGDAGDTTDAGTPNGGTPDGGTPDQGTTDAGPLEDADSKSSCAPLAPNAPTGTTDAGGTFADSSTWTAVDVVASLTEGSGEQGYSTTLSIHLTDHANACALQEAGSIDPNGFQFELEINEQSADAQPGLPAAGTYTYSSENPLDTPVFTSAKPLRGSDDPQGAPDGGCYFEGSLATAGGSGTLTLDSVSDTEVSGSFEFTDGDGGTHNGTFSAPLCLTADSGLYEGCCYEP